MYRQEGGFRAFGRGMLATFLRDVPGFMVQFYVYEGLKRKLGVSLDEENDLTNAMKLIVSGGIAGMVGWFATYPQDIVKTKLQIKRTPASAVDGGIWDCTKEIYQSGGIRAFFRGMAPCLLRALPVNGFGFLAYEQAANFMRKNN